MKSLLLLDADIIIHLYEFGYWKAVLAHFEVSVPSIVVRNEVTHFRSRDKGEVVPIDLEQQVQDGKIQEVEATSEELAQIHSDIRKFDLDGLGAGELEAISIIKSGKIPEAKFCVKDGLAVRALVFLDLADSSVSLEQILAEAGVSTKGISYSCSKKRIRDLITQTRLG